MARMDQRMLQIKQTTSQLPPSRQIKAVEEALEGEVASARSAIQDQQSYIDDTGKFLVSVPNHHNATCIFANLTTLFPEYGV